MEHVVAENVENLVLEYLRRIDRKVDGLVEDVRDLKIRMSSVELRLSTMQTDIARIDSRLDRLEIRVERIEKRLDLVETH
jgi:chromosome segregation ATPase